MIETNLSRGDLILLVVSGVTLGNLLTLLLIVGWRGFLQGRPHSRSAPIWSYVAVFLGTLFPLLALLALLDAITTALWYDAVPCPWLRTGHLRTCRPNSALSEAESESQEHLRAPIRHDQQLR